MIRNITAGIKSAVSAKKTVASVLSAFSQVVTDLEVVEAEHTAEANRHAEVAATAQVAHAAAVKEAMLARSVIGKMQGIFSPDMSSGNYSSPLRAVA